MTNDQLESLLRTWGRIYGERPTGDGDDGAHPVSGYGANSIAVAMQFAPGKRSAVIRQRTHMDRGGVARRRMMADAAFADRPPGERRMRIVPACYVDPIPARESRSVRNLARDWPVPAEIQRVQRAALDLAKVDTERGVCLRVHYCTIGSRDDKANDAAMRIGAPMTVAMYRNAVAFAKVWMHARLTRISEVA